MSSRVLVKVPTTIPNVAQLSSHVLVKVPIVKRVAAAVVKQTEAGSMTPAVARYTSNFH